MMPLEMLRRLCRKVEEARRPGRVATRVLALLAFVVPIGLGVAAWSSHASGAAPSEEGALAADPWTAYADAVRQKIQERLDATYAKDRVPGKGKSLTLRIRLTTAGDLDLVEVERPSDSIAVDEFAMRTVRDVAPFGPVPAQIQKKMDLVTISATFVLH